MLQILKQWVVTHVGCITNRKWGGGGGHKTLGDRKVSEYTTKD